MKEQPIEVDGERYVGDHRIHGKPASGNLCQ